MSELCLLVAGVLAKGAIAEKTAVPVPLDEGIFLGEVAPVRFSPPPVEQTVIPAVDLANPEFSGQNCQLSQAKSLEANWQAIAAQTPEARLAKAVTKIRPETTPEFPDVYSPQLLAPKSGSQLYYQRLAALKAGKLYTRLPVDSFYSFWSKAATKPTYEQWKQLLSLEARAVARGQGSNQLAVFVGDSLSLWFPSARLPQGQLWLNQGISGDTTSGILRRLPAFAQTRPDTIYVMAGINDLRRGASNQTVLSNLQQIVRQLRQTHPQAQIVVQSILPTRFAAIPSSRIKLLNQGIAAIASREGGYYLDLYSHFTDANDHLRRDLTTDGLHLSQQGYQVWQVALQQSEPQLMLARRARLTASVLP